MHARTCDSRETVQEYGNKLVMLCGTLMRILSTSLGSDVDQLQTAFRGDDVGTTLHVNYYPKCPQPELALGLSAHADPGGLIVLLADDCIKGLQVRKGDKWVKVQPVPSAFIVNIGDQIQKVVTDDSRFRSWRRRHPDLLLLHHVPSSSPRCIEVTGSQPEARSDGES
ncbi:hypothetical protein Cni_G01529 [Canna indica]|uniref:Fe2OG dioxygenase domain-containing protein n=1 Tax=Canna indica TaxID=4628 RepID=A0AAQ3JPF1_9LILI|nr:hypothetical protein Cni_G01529 [Canna indica]